MFESTKRKLGLWLLPDGETEPIRESDIVALRDRMERLSELYAHQERYLTGAYYSMFVDDLEDVLSGESSFGVTVEFGECGHEKVITYGTTINADGGVCPACWEDDDDV